jgi:ABC-type transport system involved in cytochrome bd biosynthesis fused ATPase/permease subunit
VILLAVLLLVNAVFNVLVWPTFYRRVAKDERAHDANGRATRFLRVHAVLIGAALLLALLSAIFGVLALAGALG